MHILKFSYILVIRSIAAVFLFFACYTTAYAAPDLELEGLDGKQHNLSDYIGQGKWVLLNIWGTRCPPCIEEMPELVIFHENHKDTDAIVVGIAIDFPSYGYADKDDVAAFVDDYFIDFPILLSDGNVTQRFGGGELKGVPTTFMYDPEGELVGYQVGAINNEIIENFIKQQTGEKSRKKTENGPESEKQDKTGEEIDQPSGG